MLKDGQEMVHGQKSILLLPTKRDPMRLKTLVGITLMSYALQSSAALETDSREIGLQPGFGVLAEQL